MERIDLSIVSKPVGVTFVCQQCFYGNYIEYDDFENNMNSLCPNDWEGEKVRCSECQSEFEIEDVQWD